MSKILVADDESRIREIIKKYAEYEGHTVIEATDGSNAVIINKTEKPDIIVMDVMMPGIDGFTACKEIRKTSNVPIIILSARGEEYDKIYGFELQVDDYVVKPFSPKELMMRINAVLKRSGNKPVARDIFTYKGLVADFTARIVSVDGKIAEMTPKEFDLFHYLVKNRGIALKREQLLSEVWGYDFFGDDRTLDTHIKLLRKSLSQYSTLITTIRGVGYRFDIKE